MSSVLLCAFGCATRVVAAMLWCFPAMPAGTNPTGPCSPLGAASHQRLFRHCAAQHQCPLTFSAWTPSPPSMPALAFQSSATHQLTYNFSQLPSRLCGICPTTTKGKGQDDKTEGQEQRPLQARVAHSSPQVHQARGRERAKITKGRRATMNSVDSRV